jgi:hypothetical protein
MGIFGVQNLLPKCDKTYQIAYRFFFSFRGCYPRTPFCWGLPPDSQEWEGREGTGKGTKERERKGGMGGEGNRGGGSREGEGRKGKGQRARKMLHPLLKTKVGAYGTNKHIKGPNVFGQTQIHSCINSRHRHINAIYKFHAP